MIAYGAMLPDAVQVADPFYLITLVGQKLDEVRRRVQNETLGHRGRKTDPLYRDSELRAEIDRLRPRALLGPLRPPAAERTTDASLQQRLDTALDDNRELRRENQLLHGQQRNETASAPHATRAIGPCH